MAGPTSDDSQLRPDNPEHLRKLAKQLLRRAREGDEAALARIGAVSGSAAGKALTLSQAQLVIAREAGFASWPRVQSEAAWRQNVRSKHQLSSAQAGPLTEAELESAMLEISEIDQIGLSCRDLDEAERFYCGVLGLELTGAVPGVMKFFGCGAVNLVLFQSETVAPNSIIYFRISPASVAIERAVAFLKSKNVQIESDPHVIARGWNGCDVWLAFFRDPFGNLLALKSDVPCK